MKPEAFPPVVLAKLLALDDEARQLRVRLARCTDAIRRHKETLLDRRRVASGMDDAAERAREELPELEEAQGKVEWLISIVESVAASCRAWLESLPEGSVLEPVSISAPKGTTLGGVRASIASTKSEIAALRSAPVPSADIRERIEQRVAKLGANLITVSGLDQGQALQIGWPVRGDEFMVGQRNATKNDLQNGLLTLACALLPTEMADLAMREVEKLANTPLPVAERPARIAALEAELEKLMRIEELLVVKGDEQREASRPAHVILGVKVVEARGVRAA